MTNFEDKELIIKRFTLSKIGSNTVKLPTDGCRVLSVDFSNGVLTISVLGSVEGFNKIDELEADELNAFDVEFNVIAADRKIESRSIGKFIGSVSNNYFMLYVFADYHQYGNGVLYR